MAPSSFVLLLLLFIQEGRCQPTGPGLLDRAPPPLAEVLKGAPPAVDPSLQGNVERVAGWLTDEVQKKYAFCMSDVYVCLLPCLLDPRRADETRTNNRYPFEWLSFSFRAKELYETFNFQADSSFASECMEQTGGTATCFSAVECDFFAEMALI
jgi:hypothetical protein